jgi:hypothetical protein
VSAGELKDSDWLWETVASVRRELRAFAGDYESRGLRVVDLAVDGPRDAPELALYLTHESVGGERVLRYPLVQEGRRVGPSDAGRDVGLWAFESTAELIARLPESQR